MEPSPQIYCKYSMTPLINASGCNCSTTKMLSELVEAPGLFAVMTKSATLDPRAGNPEPRYWEAPDRSFTINAMGLPNCGIKYYLEYYKGLGDRSMHARFVSIAGLSLEENKAMLDIIFSQDMEYYKYIDAIEINLSCPNLVGHSQLAYDFNDLDSYLSELLPYIRARQDSFSAHYIAIGLKLPPYFEASQFDIITSILKKQNEVFDHCINFIHCINSVPNGLIIDPATEAPVIKPKGGLGGLGGSIIKPVAVANVRAFYTRFKQAGLEIDIIGSGGIGTGTDVFEFILAGAEMVSIGSQLMIEGPCCFNRICAELMVIMQEKGYTTLESFRGKLKDLH